MCLSVGPAGEPLLEGASLVVHLLFVVAIIWVRYKVGLGIKTAVRGERGRSPASCHSEYDHVTKFDRLCRDLVALDKLRISAALQPSRAFLNMVHSHSSGLPSHGPVLSVFKGLIAAMSDSRNSSSHLRAPPNLDLEPIPIATAI
jgi:hypothetical protein